MLLVGSFEPFDEAEARRVGADDYLTKPFQSIRTLIGKVGNLLTGGGSRESEEATTRRLAPLPEAEKENRSNADYLERSTADTAPLPDVHEDEDAGKREVSFADLSMDDRMIETTPAVDYGSSGQNTQSRPTAQYSAADLKDAGLAPMVEDSPAPAPQEEEKETVPAQQETVGSFASAQRSEQAPVAASQPQAATRPSGFASSDDSLLDLGDMQTPSAMTEADDFFLDLFDETPEKAQAGPSSLVETSAPSFESAQAASYAPAEEQEAAPPQPQAQDFVEAHVVEEDKGADFAPVEAEATPDAGYEPAQEARYLTQKDFPVDAQLAPTERLPDDYKLEGAMGVSPAAEAVPERAATADAPRAGQITLEQLSPEVIDAIARRAVEHLSERVVEQIAWEVVPDLAELLIKRRLEEEKK
jgi:CheY-like chemotaxis protein